ncbi:helix-turn-helix transcriptional regulator [Bacillus cereus]|uniref:Helix-turn-helix domain-containing protein n=1 Tax=Bacillus cereus TaxID=1396 RepID=A0AAW5KTS2_BACCE|nr:helix-turn-helix transcriptional regulator [Bacillus cereus]MCQ6284873.1 helix-turn-helix domain-containing protein [Bacillus cereus]MCQ6305927.1 helix-turn-helix domain-containing protein [Bacillus cereus]MCQ6313965.1 helix-turn-helix domain-containing protein [Bacillus cereus]MCQ6330328.1 helix-turn-helix domain-containing protein [Bacillus cereus]MCQ6381855.1 helix-turn-helix domain-containing protein [Bacillus cereus]
MNKNLFIARKERRMLQKDVGKVVNMHKNTYHLKESGKRDFTLKEAQKLAKYFKTTVDELFEK